MDHPFEAAERAAAAIRRATGAERHDLCVVLGSGWAEAADRLPTGQEMAMSELPGFAVPSVRGHTAWLRSAEVGDARVLLARGRVHLYEGRTPAEVVHTVRAAAAAGCTAVVLTNAAGVMDRTWPIGGTVLISDQINMTGASPLEGPAYTDLTDLYASRLRDLVREIAPGIPEGVYVGTRGPEFETPAEIAAYAVMGARLVGMSTVLEAIAAAHCGMEVLGLAMATNLAAGVGLGRVDAGDVFAAAAEGAAAAADLLHAVVRRLAGDGR